MALTTRITALLLATLCAAAPAFAAGDRYRVEVIVFRNVGVPAEPVELDTVRRFSEAFEFDEPSPPEAPTRLDKQDGTFANIWTRLERLADYEPLVRLTFEQTLFDYHPPVRLHDDEVMGEELRFPGNLAYIDLTRAGANGGWFDDYVMPLYRLDGTVQLRRSRFLHVDLDLEYRLDGPAWDREFPAPAPRLEPGFEWLGEPPAPLEEPTVVDPLSAGFLAEDGVEPEPFRVHRLDQSRQIRTNTMQYFDSAFLGAIVRVTPIADDGT